MCAASAASQDLFTRAANGSIPVPPDHSEAVDRDPNPILDSDVVPLSILIKSRSSNDSYIANKGTPSNDASSKIPIATNTPHSGSGSSSASGNGNAHSSSINVQNSKNNHLNPFYELSRMTAADLRNYRYNSGLEEVDGW